MPRDFGFGRIARALHDSASVASWHLTYELLGKLRNPSRVMPPHESGHLKSDIEPCYVSLCILS
jgi:hypothetical protein